VLPLLQRAIISKQSRCHRRRRLQLTVSVCARKRKNTAYLLSQIYFLAFYVRRLLTPSWRAKTEIAAAGKYAERARAICVKIFVCSV
jgi:hypothetical protein